MAPPKQQQRPNATTIERSAIARLQDRILAECPDRGYAPPLNQKVAFRSLPLSEATLRGLEEGDGRQRQNQQQQQRGRGRRRNQQQKCEDGAPSADAGSGTGKRKSTHNLTNKKQFWNMTDIQNACIPHALRGRDILGAARTGR